MFRDSLIKDIGSLLNQNMVTIEKQINPLLYHHIAKAGEEFRLLVSEHLPPEYANKTIELYQHVFGTYVKPEEIERVKEYLSRSDESFGLSSRALNCLGSKFHRSKGGQITVRDISDLSDEDLLKIRGLGKTILEEIKNKILTYEGKDIRDIIIDVRLNQELLPHAPLP